MAQFSIDDKQSKIKSNIGVRLTQKEYRRLKAAAGKSSVSVEEFARQAVTFCSTEILESDDDPRN